MLTQTECVVFLHAIWHTADGSNTINAPEGIALKGFLQRKAEERAVVIDAMGIQPDHVHALLQLQATQPPDTAIKWLMAESEAFINTIQTKEGQLTWQPFYLCFSVSPNTLSKAREYIGNQARMHEQLSFAQELDKILALVEK